MDAAIATLPIDKSRLRAILSKHGVVAASVFGSFARGEARPESDLDLLIKPSANTSLFDILDLQKELEEATQHPVDLVTKLHPRFEPYITPELVPIL